MIERRRYMGLTALPYDYEVEWVSGIALNTGVLFNNDISYDISIGTTVYNREGMTGIVWQGNHYFNIRYKSGGVVKTFTTSKPYQIDTMYHIQFNKDKSKFIIDDYVLDKTMPIDSYTDSRGVRTANFELIGRFKLYSDGTLVRSYIPCVVNGRGTLYEELSETFKGDTDTFGPIVTGGVNT